MHLIGVFVFSHRVTADDQSFDLGSERVHFRVAVLTSEEGGKHVEGILTLFGVPMATKVDARDEGNEASAIGICKACGVEERSLDGDVDGSWQVAHEGNARRT